MIWIEITVSNVLVNLPTDVRAHYDTWISSHPEKSVRLAEITLNTLREFRDAIKSNPANIVDSRETHLPQSAVRHCENIIIFTLAMEIGIQLSTAANSARTSADVFLRMIPQGRWNTTTETDASPSPRYTVPGRSDFGGRMLPAILALMFMVCPVWASWLRPSEQIYDYQVLTTFNPSAYTNSAITLFGHLGGINQALLTLSGGLAGKAEKSIYGPYSFHLFRTGDDDELAAIYAGFDNIDNVSFYPRIILSRGAMGTVIAHDRISSPALTISSITLGTNAPLTTWPAGYSELDPLWTAQSGPVWAAIGFIQSWPTNDWRNATNIVAGSSDGYNAATRTLTWNTNAVASSAEPVVDPVFFIPNNEIALWTDVAVKASTNNFSDWLFFYRSGDPLALVDSAQLYPVRPEVWYTQSGAQPAKMWNLPPAGASIWESINANDHYVGGWVLVIRGYNKTKTWWDQVQFSFFRETDTLVQERDYGYYASDGGRIVWCPIVPTQYIGTNILFAH